MKTTKILCSDPFQQAVRRSFHEMWGTTCEKTTESLELLREKRNGRILRIPVWEERLYIEKLSLQTSLKWQNS